MRTPKRRRNNMIALLVVVAVGAFFIFLNSFKPKEPDTVAHSSTDELYDAPVKTQVMRRITLEEPADQKQMAQLIRKEVAAIDGKSYKYHPKPTHIYIYVYPPGTIMETGYEWSAMFSRVNGIDEPIKYK